MVGEFVSVGVSCHSLTCLLSASCAESCLKEVGTQSMTSKLNGFEVRRIQGTSLVCLSKWAFPAIFQCVSHRVCPGNVVQVIYTYI